MTRKFLLLFSLFGLIILSGCGNGAESIPELSDRLFQALKSKSNKKFEKCMPTLNQMQKGYVTYFADGKKTKEEQKKDGLDEAATRQLNLNQQFAKLLSAPQYSQMDWNKATISDFALKYDVTDRKEGFQEAKVRMTAKAGTVLFTAWHFGDRWFVVEDLKWEQ
jgi:hypothetical protein